MSGFREQLTQSLIAHRPDIPPETARRKAHSVAKGILLFVVGLLCVTLGFTTVVVVVIVTRGGPGHWLLLFAGLPVVAGVYLIFAGGNTASGEAMDAAAEQSSGLLRAVARVVRPKNGGTQ